jgi:hypothetical protein
MSIILLNAGVLTMVWVGISKEMTENSELLQDIFNYIFIAECMIKIVVYQKFYFYSGWNIFDFTVVLGGLFGTIGKDSFAGKISVIRILRVCRVLRLLKKAKRLYIIFNSFIHTIPAFVNVGSLIMIMIYIFAILGNRVFARVMLDD